MVEINKVQKYFLMLNMIDIYRVDLNLENYFSPEILYKVYIILK